MNFIKEIRGLKFPDPYIIKFFFKEGLHKEPKNVLELGCSNGNNLSLFYSYGHNVVGIDMNKINIENAKYNFEKIFKTNTVNTFKFIEGDIRNIENLIDKNNKFDILLIPNVINYILKKDFLSLLSKVKIYLSKKGFFFIRFRSPRDMRVALSQKIDNDQYITTSDITDEKNAYLTVYEESDMVLILKENLNIFNYKIFHLYEENYHTDRKILNADIVIWGNFSL